MQKLVLQVCVSAAIIFAAVDMFVTQELETLNGMPNASDNVWRYYAAGEEGSPAADVACVKRGDWVSGAMFDAGSGALELSSYVFCLRFYHSGANYERDTQIRNLYQLSP